ncbi:hypothetical protein C900_04388 [Fulvivirga imtechensis AK7]|uniref:Activator of Hsp90 ATPase homologue 1/2-like C-terminal domain-containing protein n=1 Tax=Fulvivirga imtechensis AK7 TaxID=1237149 RepID=L8JP84_9BACT|nr:SRPBCC domain-containing protein [Fulvivirga imtechensis]ELR70018.1 hypothetical protein C900_04388 [Fulvivirga imtechensis AK7]
MQKEVGLTKDVGYQFGLRKTFPVSVEQAWDFLFSDKGLKIWLGALDSELELNMQYKTTEGIEGLVRVIKPYSHVRMNWKKKNWKNMSTVQVRTIENNGKTTISFHQEKLLNAAQREEMKAYWNRKMNELSEKLTANSQE